MCTKPRKKHAPTTQRCFLYLLFLCLGSYEHPSNSFTDVIIHAFRTVIETVPLGTDIVNVIIDVKRLDIVNVIIDENEHRQNRLLPTRLGAATVT